MTPVSAGSQRRLIRAVAEAGVEFVLIGGHAVSAHGYERATRDVDVVYSTRLESCRRLTEALSELGAVVDFADVPPPRDGISPGWLAAGGHFRFATDVGPLDALSKVAGFDYQVLVRNAIEVDLSGARVRICSYDDLVALKRASGRPRDDLDLIELEDVRHAAPEGSAHLDADQDVATVAVDWSGDKSSAQRTRIWSGVCSSAVLRSLTNGRSRNEVVDDLMNRAGSDPDLVVGFDFAFSMPAWFVRENGASSGPEFWHVVAERGAEWLDRCPRPFFGRAGVKRSPGVELFRRTDLKVPPVAGQTPKSVFQLIGRGQVGPGSIRGMPLLRLLKDRGFHVWPFDAASPGAPLVVEIYPRLLTGPVVKSDADSRRASLEAYAGVMPWRLRERASCGEDAFDAAVSATVMNQARGDLLALQQGDTIDRIEGRIWLPDDPTLPGRS